MTKQQKADLARALESLSTIVSKFAEQCDPERTFKIRRANQLDACARTLREIYYELDFENENEKTKEWRKTRVDT